MKKFVLISGLILLLMFISYELYYTMSIDVGWHSEKEPAVWVTTVDKQVYLKDEAGEWNSFTILGVDLGSGMPGGFATEFKISYEMYMEWFELIADMNANTIRVYTVQAPAFYRAFYDFNVGRETPLYMLHGVWVDDDVMRSHNSAFAPQFKEVFEEDCRKIIDIIHGNRTIRLNDRYAYGRYRYNVSPWVLGYILGVEWEQDVVLYTNNMFQDDIPYEGKYLYTNAKASAFEKMLAQVGDALYQYESSKYGEQRLLAFSNWPETDPLEHQIWRKDQSTNLSKIDVENIFKTEELKSGMFASYHVYPYYPLFMDFEPQFAEYIDENHVNNPYKGYLIKLNEHHTIPVIITEFGLPSSRGLARINLAREMNQGGLTEKQQAEKLPLLLDDIMSSGCSGAVVFAWQDEWFKRTWNTWPGVNLSRCAYWSDYQTNEQFFGLVTFDPGKESSVCYVDGDTSEWDESDIVSQTENIMLQMKYDEKFIYLRIAADKFNPRTDRFYIPIDLTDKSGALSESESGLEFERPVDFLIIIDGEENSRVLVQEYYDLLYATERRSIWGEDAYSNRPPVDSPVFHLVQQFLRAKILFVNGGSTYPWLYPTGQLTYGNANPNSSQFNSLADFIFTDDGVEMRIPYGLLNFSDASTMKIHDDYYVNYGVKEQEIKYMGVQAMWENTKTQDLHSTAFGDVGLKGWDDDPTWHMRLKESYYSMQEAFAKYGTKEG